jgi:WD domain, G-beta repeat/WD40-like Beta Propeller Repeat
VASVAISPDGETIAAGYSGNRLVGGVLLWDVAARQRAVADPLAVSEGTVTSVAVSPDGKTIAAGHSWGRRQTGGLVLWDVGTRKRLVDQPLAVKEGYVESVAFSPDGKTIAAGYIDSAVGGVVLWDVAARKRRLEEPLRVKEGGVESVAFSPDGKRVATGYGKLGGSGGGVVLLDTDVDVESWQGRAGRLANRNFTREEWREYFSEKPYQATFPDLPVPPEVTPQ